MFQCLGILREAQNSPNRETDDAMILKEVLSQLETLGMKTRLTTPENLEGRDGNWDLILPMCESYSGLVRLKAWAESSSALWINPPHAILNCYRTQMVPALLALSGVRFPPSEVRRVEETGAPPRAFHAAQGWWIKRGDVHNTCDRDVVFVRAWPEVAGRLRDFAEREITHWIIQPHLVGDLLKFYGVGPGRWFTWFYHNPLRANRFPFDVDDLAGQAATGARVLDLEVFGGDAIVAEDGEITLIDMNSWPSFALVRREAAVQIAWHLQSRLKTASRQKQLQAKGS